MLAQTNAVEKQGEDSGGKKRRGEWTRQVQSWTRKTILAKDKACMAIF